MQNTKFNREHLLNDISVQHPEDYGRFFIYLIRRNASYLFF